MATVTDQLVTTMSLQGANAVLASLNQMSTSLFGVAAAEGVATAATTALDGALVVLDTLLSPVTVALAIVTAGIAETTKSLSAFSEEEAGVSRMALQLRNLKGSIPMAELQRFSEHLEGLTGISHTVIETLGATAAQFGLNKSQIEKLLPTVLDIAQAKGLDPAAVEKILLRASRGRAQGLVGLGIDPSKIRGDLKNIDNLINQVGSGFKGVAEGFRNTLPGTTAALGTAMDNLFKALGRFISPVVVPLLNTFIKGLQMATDLLDRIADMLHIARAGDAALGGSGANPLALKGDPEQTEALRSIDANTAKTAEAFHKAVLGGPGTIANRAFSARDARIAFGV